MNRKTFVAMMLACGAVSAVQAQDKLYPNTFALGEVRLTGGPMLKAETLNVENLLKYDVDRLLAPYLKEAGLAAKAESYPNWLGLDGHVGGHYLTALAIHFAATGNKEIKQRMDYMIDELERCQNATGDGYLCGVPDGRKCWNEVRRGNVRAVRDRWVPWYNIHKIYAGLRDAWMYGGSEKAKQMFLKLCDWGITVIQPLTDSQMEQMLDTEFGGMDEVYADAYQITGNVKYLDAAKRFSHRWLLDSMAKGIDNLDNTHANTQVPKVVGYQRIAELSRQAGRAADAELYRRAADFFWHTVVNTRSLALGGNSRREHFAAASDCKSYVTDRQGPESCNTNNMMKLTEGLFRMEQRAEYADFYERAMFNHILSTQHPGHGGYVYFTPARPAHYRVYSAPNEAMWCCVGTGMENHGKYGEFIYTHTGGRLFVNLFVPSALQWKEKGITITQQTAFPYSDTSRLVVDTKRKVRATLMVRYPGWCRKGDMKIVVGGKDYAKGAEPQSYVEIDRKWKKGDVVEISMPMQTTVEQLPNVSEYIAIMRGPILLGARMGTDNMEGLVADDSRWGHIANGQLVSVFDTPIIKGTRKEILAKLGDMQPVEGKPLHFTVPGLFDGKYRNLELEPFFGIHDSRYMMYWLSMTDSQFAEHQKAIREAEERRLALDRRTVDAVGTGEQQPEVDHKMKSSNSYTGNSHGEPWRDARDGGWFEFEMDTKGNTDLALMVRYWGDEGGNRKFDILVDNKLIATENIARKWRRSEHVNAEYPIPAGLLEGKKTVNVKFQSHKGNTAGGVFFVRLVKPEKK